VLVGPGGAAFLDRDGTINVKAPEGDYVKSPEEVTLLPGAARAVRALNDAGVVTVVVTNQRGIALGRMSERDLDAVNERVAALLDEEAGARLDKVLHCPHDEGVCDCRKPGIGMLRRAAAEVPGLSLEHSVMIGDSESDVQAGRTAGMRTIRLGREAPDLWEAVQRVLA
jgi:D-glycero-D-manno-heptose 1,7-bisphosphate phosphatase